MEQGAQWIHRFFYSIPELEVMTDPIELTMEYVGNDFRLNTAEKPKMIGPK